jgi:hypothetical protein
MQINLEPVKKILSAFLEDIQNVKDIRKQISAPQPALSFTIQDRLPEFVIEDFNPASDSFWENEDAYIWLYADAWNFRALMHKPKSNPTPVYYSQLARPLYQQWRQETKEVFNRKCEMIPLPAAELSLIAYLQRIALAVTEENEHRDVWIESLRSFLQFLRDDTHLDQKGPLELLFPSKESCKGMDLLKINLLQGQGTSIKKVKHQAILRCIEDTVYPIDIFAASEILQNLFKTVLEGRSNSQRSAAEALGFAWLCHAVACYRLVTRENLIFSTEISSFRPPLLNETREWIKPTHFIGVSSLFGIIDVPVSKTLYKYLLALPRDPGSQHIFNMDWETVLRTFRNKGVKQSDRARNLGQITFLTFMSQPHVAIGHRASSKKKQSKLKKLSPTKESE